MQDIQLHQIFKFTKDDLKANREGRVSSAQAKKYEVPKVSKLALMVILGHALFIGGILGVIAIITAKPAMWIVFGIVMAMGILPFTLMHNEGNINPTLRGDAEGGVVNKACGILIVDPDRNPDKKHVEVLVDGTTFKVSQSQCDAFVDKELYCIYYFPRTRMVLTVEPYHEE